MNIKNKYQVVIEKLDDLGNGITYLNNKICFVKGALPQELVEVSVIEEKKKYLKAELIRIIEPNKNRSNPLCPYNKICGGCSLAHLKSSKVLEYKAEKVQNIILKNTNIKIEPELIESNNIYNYRNKVTLKIQDYKWGYYSSKTHNFIPITTCLLAQTPLNNVIEAQKSFKIQNGEITLRCNDKQEVLISIETKHSYQIDYNILKELNIVGIVINDKTIYNNNYFYHTINNLKFKITYNSFFQINDFICFKIFTILNELNLKGNILDLYCGVGSLGLALAQNANHVYGIEIIENAIKDAKINAELNNLKNTTYFSGKVQDNLKKIQDKIDTIIVDPPRKGLDNIQEILKINAKNIIYISCDPLTLGRDLKTITEKYSMEKSFVLNMFPNTYHVESVIFLQKKNI